MQAISCQSDPQTVAHLAASFGFVLPPTWRNLYTVEEARAIIRARIEEEIVGLKQLAALFQAIDPASRAGALEARAGADRLGAEPLDAAVPQDCGNRF